MEPAEPSHPTYLEDAFRADRPALLALSYRLTGSMGEAEEVVQETFVRALERPPPRSDLPLRPWLVRVATNLSLDALRRRRRRVGQGPWLPDPVASPDPEAVPAPEAESPERRHDLVESVTFAFLLALEALGPRQRAALVLTDVLDYSAREAGEVLGLSEGNVRVTLHRARKALHRHEELRQGPTEEVRHRTRKALEELTRCLVRHDATGLASLMAEDARALTDSGGEYTALTETLVGRERLARLLLTVASRRLAGSTVTHCWANAMPAVLIEFGSSERRQAPCALLRCELDGDQRIAEIHVVLGPRKLAHLGL